MPYPTDINNDHCFVCGEVSVGSGHSFPDCLLILYRYTRTRTHAPPLSPWPDPWFPFQLNLRRYVRAPTVPPKLSHLGPVSGMTTPDPPKYSLWTNQRRVEMMDCPLTNRGPYTSTFRIGAKRVKHPAKQISAKHSLDQSHEGLQRGKPRGDWVQKLEDAHSFSLVPFSAQPESFLPEATSNHPASFLDQACLKGTSGKSRDAGRRKRRECTGSPLHYEQAEQSGTGGRAKAWSLRIHAEASLSRGPGRKPGASVSLSISLSTVRLKCGGAERAAGPARRAG